LRNTWWFMHLYESISNLKVKGTHLRHYWLFWSFHILGHNSPEVFCLETHSFKFDISELISLCHKLKPQVTPSSLGRFYNSGQCANSCSRGSVFFCWQVEKPVLVCWRSNC
jgi:hypothetical protein